MDVGVEDCEIFFADFSQRYSLFAWVFACRNVHLIEIFFLIYRIDADGLAKSGRCNRQYILFIQKNIHYESIIGQGS